MMAMIPAAISNPAGNPFANTTARRVPIKTPTNIVGFIGNTPTPFPPIQDTINPATMDPHPIGEVSTFMMRSLDTFPDVTELTERT